MRLREYFYDEENEDNEYKHDEYSKFHKSNDWTPSPGRDRWLDMYIQEVKDDIIKGLNKNFKMNINEQEETALRELLYDETIVIRPSDKSNTIVILNREDYELEVEKELKDNTTYKPVKNDLTQKNENKVKKLVENLYKRSVITQDMKRYLLPKGSTSGKVQANPKLHKQNHPVRTIINGRNHPTEKIAELVENELTEHVRSLPSFLQDTTDFLKKLNEINQPLPDNAIMFCLDVKSLYPSVPRKEAREACKAALNDRSTQSIPTEDVLKMLDLVLENNNFSFNNKHFLQTEGTAIGSHLGMNYACTFLGRWEKDLFDNTTKLPTYYWRYVDDIFGIWEHGVKELEIFHKFVNDMHPQIQTELRFSSEIIEFLDVSVSIKNGFVKTDLFTKDTDKHQYLHVTSSHPNSIKRAIPYGLGIRIKRICSDPEDYSVRRQEVKSHLRKRGYKDHLIEEQLKKVDTINRDQLLNYKQKTENNRVPLVITFSKALPNVHRILRKNMKTLHRSERLKQIFQTPPIVAFKRDKNIKDILVHKKHNLMFYKSTNECTPCGQSCALCSHVIKTDNFTDNDGNEYKIQGNINCKTVGVIYNIICSHCNKLMYVGQTGDSLYQRMLLNFSKIRTGKTDDPVAKHFSQPGHSANNLKVVGIEKVYGNDTYRKVKVFWMKKFKTLQSYGLNSQYQDASSFNFIIISI